VEADSKSPKELKKAEKKLLFEFRSLPVGRQGRVLFFLSAFETREVGFAYAATGCRGVAGS
jgi:hypothetical protein